MSEEKREERGSGSIDSRGEAAVREASGWYARLTADSVSDGDWEGLESWLARSALPVG